MTGQARAVRQAWNTIPTAVTLPLGMTLLGTHALIRGDHVSRAFTNLGGGVMIRVIGALMVIGGVLVAISIRRNDERWEMAGLACSAASAVLFGCGVVFGLRELGSLAGGGFLLIGVGLIGRIRLLNRGQASRSRRPTGE